MVCKSVFKVLMAMLLLSGCRDIPRDNILDPKNPDSYRESLLLVEAFVNTAKPDDPYNLWALAALDSLHKIYGSRIQIAEYHRDVPGYPDQYSQLTFETLYDKYVSSASTPQKGVPDIFINGSARRVQGASAVTSVASRLNALISDLLVQNSYFTLQAGDVSYDGSQLTAECKVARLGNSDAPPVLLKMLIVRKPPEYGREIICDIRKYKATIPALNAGEIRSQKFDPVSVTPAPLAVLFCLSSADELTVYQTIRVEIP